MRGKVIKMDSSTKEVEIEVFQIIEIIILEETKVIQKNQ